MSQPVEPYPAKLIIRFLFSDPGVQIQALNTLVSDFGPMDFLSAPELFHTPPITMKKWVWKSAGRRPAFWNSWRRSLCRISSFAPMKLRPACYVMANGRLISIRDFSALERFILATGKNFTHRIYLRNGIYADLTLIYQKGAYRALPWTYPDYLEPELLHYLRVLRKKLRFQLDGILPR